MTSHSNGEGHVSVVLVNFGSNVGVKQCRRHIMGIDDHDSHCI